MQDLTCAPLGAPLTTDEFTSALVHRVEDNDLPEAEAMTALREWVYGAWDSALEISGMAPEGTPPAAPLFQTSRTASGVTYLSAASQDDAPAGGHPASGVTS
ncbi:hypothetical protein [Mameliella alba]|uniref:Uncharacterized protein n=1 Tax=Mameliella alba TaxID=561184 RepID=A0A0B3RU80_9RHOB|nr:hypothetical protein [Mameliella alba]KHQ50313.1 hypothetical protein OA50_05161 [Mameliella alba]